MKGKVIVITGPTASGKSALAVDMAERLGTEIISADSRQVYKGIPIVTAMPTAEQQRRARHHLINMLELDEYYSAARFEEDAVSLARGIIKEKGVAVVCGGSMMYIDAFCKGLDNLPTIPAEIREELKDEHERLGDGWLLSELERVDPEYRATVDSNNIKRVFHAIEIVRASGQTYTSLRTGVKKEREFDIERIVIDLPREELFSRINLRVDGMVRYGLEEEAARVYPMRHLNSLNTVGLKEMFAWFDGTMNRTTAIERIKKNTRVYAKKQMTWLKKSR